VKVPTEFVSDSSGHVTTQQAWAMYVRRRWPTNTVKASMSEWGLTEGQAKGLLYGNASQSTIEAIDHHPRGGMGLALHIQEIKFQTLIADWLEEERERRAHEHRQQEAKDARLAQMARHLGSVLHLVPGRAVERDLCGTEEPRSFAGRVGDQPDRRPE